MSIFLFLLAATQAAPAQAALPAVTPTARLGRGFLSPMGEPFFGRRVGEDGLVVWFAGADPTMTGRLQPMKWRPMRSGSSRFSTSIKMARSGQTKSSDTKPRSRRRSVFELRWVIPARRQRQLKQMLAAMGYCRFLSRSSPLTPISTAAFPGEEFRRRHQSLSVAGHEPSGRLSLSQLQSIRQSALAASIRGVQKPQEAGEITQNSGRGADTGMPTPSLLTSAHPVSRPGRDADVKHAHASVIRI